MYRYWSTSKLTDISAQYFIKLIFINGRYKLNGQNWNSRGWDIIFWIFFIFFKSHHFAENIWYSCFDWLSGTPPETNITNSFFHSSSIHTDTAVVRITTGWRTADCLSPGDEMILSELYWNAPQPQIRSVIFSVVCALSLLYLYHIISPGEEKIETGGKYLVPFKYLIFFPAVQPKNVISGLYMIHVLMLLEVLHPDLTLPLKAKVLPPVVKNQIKASLGFKSQLTPGGSTSLYFSLCTISLTPTLPQLISDTTGTGIDWCIDEIWVN